MEKAIESPESTPKENTLSESTSESTAAEREISSAKSDSNSAETKKKTESNGAPTEEDLESIKLFVGQVPTSFVSTSQLKPLFDPYGEIVEVKIVFERGTNVHRGCAFVTFSKREYAENAIEGLHGKMKLPGASNPMQVKFAKNEAKPVITDHKLFIGMVAKSASEDDLRRLFAPYGEIMEVSILRDPSTGESRSCGFVKFVEKQSALNAIEALNKKHTMDGQNSALCVKFADNQRQREERKRQKHAQQMQHMHARMPPMLHSLQPMPPQPANAFVMGNSYPAMYAPSAAPQMGLPTAQSGAPYQQHQQQHHHQGYPTQHSAPEDYGNQAQHYQTYTMPSAYTQQGAYPSMGYQQAPQQAQTGQAASGPSGSNLFIMHLPLEWNDADLYSYFASYGNVVSAKVFIDKATGLSKCFGFVSYDNPQSAQYAIQYMDGYQVGGKRLRVSLKREGNGPY